MLGGMRVISGMLQVTLATVFIVGLLAPLFRRSGAAGRRLARRTYFSFSGPESCPSGYAGGDSYIVPPS